MLFGANNERSGVRGYAPEVVTVGQDGYTLDKILTHDAHTKDTTLHSMLAAMKYPDYPVALGVIRSVEDEIVYDQAVEKQVEEVKARARSTVWTTCSTRALLGRSNLHRYIRNKKAVENDSLFR